LEPPIHWLPEAAPNRPPRRAYKRRVNSNLDITFDHEPYVSLHFLGADAYANAKKAWNGYLKRLSRKLPQHGAVSFALLAATGV